VRKTLLHATYDPCVFGCWCALLAAVCAPLQTHTHLEAKASCILYSTRSTAAFLMLTKFHNPTCSSLNGSHQQSLISGNGFRVTVTGAKETCRQGLFKTCKM
jgi:hypothetical protein